MKPQARLFLTTLAGWMNRKQQDVIEYLMEENRILKEQFDSTGKKLRLNNHQRRNLAMKGRILGWKKLQEYANLVTPQTVYRWHNQLIALKYTAKRKVRTDRQKEMLVIGELCVKFAEDKLEPCGPTNSKHYASYL